MRRRLDPEEQALWGRVVAGVRPLFGQKAPVVPPSLDGRGRGWVESTALPLHNHPTPTPSLKGRGSAANTLDASWDRRLARGLVGPDMTLDLHGHSLAAAHDALEAGLARAVAREARLVLLVTGRAPTTEWTGGARRGAIRASVADWLAGSRFNDRIAAVRHAHPRHGGAGALYLVVRRNR